ncbi:conserved hypothetical protein [Theileria orientalis strain Shintoku]|uniref:SBF1/SBF2 domain-containing protein n=1 Tax=Theileria orientalis strain Shintoku TaxID=869250 RepID=J4DQ24_THEOR|nr:conserved hypothetical protein [Theileria orientalis strain Shintoku]PVC53653.1 hypothetical protein MACL_00003625 [Theileria orientalis]BAM41709.1 conserved hypothetical protein [Theileria orientalis strain Shintoku]|eukprot:XP_009692010.1 conserved hypothetical protein [Theileria orientalis strain Shintoku]
MIVYKRRNPGAKLKKNNIEIKNDSQRTSSLSTEYQSEIGKLSRVDTIDDDVSAKTTPEDPSINHDPLNDFTAHFSKILSYVFSKKESLKRDSKLQELLKLVFSDFCSIEHQYVQGMRELSERIDLSSGGYSDDSIMMVKWFKTYIKRLSDNHRDFVEAISTECVLEDTNQKLYEINKQINELKKALEEYKSDRTKYISGLKEMYLKAKSKVSICLEATHQAPSIKTSVHKTLIPVILNFVEVTNLVDKSDEFKFFVSFNNKVDSLVNTLMDLERKKSAEIKDSLAKFVVYETSKLRNLQYDLNEMIDELNKDRPIISFEEEYVNKQKEWMPKIGQCRSLELQNGVDKDKNEGYTSATIQPPSIKVICKIESSLERFIEYVWGKNQVISLKEFSEEMQSSLVRQIFCEIVSRNAVENPELKSKDKFQLLADMVNLVLMVSEKQSDYWTGYSVMKLSDRIYTVVDSEEDERCYLWSMIGTNNYWKKREFWEECLTIIISMDLKAMFETLGSLSPGAKKIECVPITEDPLTFQERMYKYGIPALECEEIVNRVCKNLRMPQTYTEAIIQV